MQAHSDKVNGLAERWDSNGFLKCETKEMAAITCTYEQAVLGKHPPEHQHTSTLVPPPTIFIKGITFPLPEMSEEAGVMGLPPGSNMSAYSLSPRMCGAGRSAVELSALYPSAPPGVDGAGGPRGAVRRASRSRCGGISEPAGSASAVGGGRGAVGSQEAAGEVPASPPPRRRR